jgi:hypothetical protein
MNYSFTEGSTPILALSFIRKVGSFEKNQHVGGLLAFPPLQTRRLFLNPKILHPNQSAFLDTTFAWPRERDAELKERTQLVSMAISENGNFLNQIVDTVKCLMP